MDVVNDYGLAEDEWSLDEDGEVCEEVDGRTRWLKGREIVEERNRLLSKVRLQADRIEALERELRAACADIEELRRVNAELRAQRDLAEARAAGRGEGCGKRVGVQLSDEYNCGDVVLCSEDCTQPPASEEAPTERSEEEEH